MMDKSLGQVTIGGLVLPGHSSAWKVDQWGAGEFRNWDDLADAKGMLADRALGHGGFAPALTRRSPLVATLTCFLQASTPWELQQSRRRLKAVGATAGTVRVTVEREGEVRWRDGRVAGIHIVDSPVRSELSAEIDFVFPDPRQFGPAQPISETAFYPKFRLDNSLGSAEGLLELTVIPIEPARRVVLTMDGQQLAVESPINSGAAVEFFSDSGVVLTGGVFAQRVRGVWPRVGPGEARTLQVDAAGSNVRVGGNFYPAWW